MNLPPPSDIFESLRLFRSCSLFCDVRIQYSDSQLEFFVHRVVIAAASPFFRARLSEQDEIQVIRMPAECPVEVTAFILSWLYHEPTKLELNDDPANVEFLLKLKLGADFLGISELRSHVDVVINQIHGVKQEKDEGTDDAASLEPGLLASTAVAIRFVDQISSSSRSPPSRGKRILRDVSNEKRLVVSLDRVQNKTVGNEPLSIAKDSDDESVDNSTGDSGVVGDSGVAGDSPYDSSPMAKEGKIVISAEVKFEIGFEAEEVKNAPTVKKPRKRPASTAAGEKKNITFGVKRRRKRKHILTNPPCPIKRKEKVEVKRTLDREEVITCEFCGKQMKRREQSKHNRSVHRYVIWQKKNGPVNDPMLNEHLNENKFECKKCGFTIPRESKKFEREAAKHLYKTHNILCASIALACPHEGCTSVHWTKTRLSQHEREKHLTPRPRIPCPICNKQLLASSIKAHVEEQHRDATKPFEHLCETCGRGFASKSKVATHERATHFKGKGIFTCDQCDEAKPFQTVNRESLLHHQYYLHGILPEGVTLYSCNQCDFKTPVKFNLTRHVKRKHMELQMYPCPECGKEFQRSGFLDAHITRVHRSGESHPCDECEAVFRSAAGIRYHRWKFHRTGSNGPQRDDPNHWFDKPFMCGYCPHTSGLAGNLKKHLANMHKDMPVKVIDLRKARKEAKANKTVKDGETIGIANDENGKNGDANLENGHNASSGIIHDYAADGCSTNGSSDGALVGNGDASINFGNNARPGVGQQMRRREIGELYDKSELERRKIDMLVNFANRYV